MLGDTLLCLVLCMSLQASAVGFSRHGILLLCLLGRRLLCDVLLCVMLDCACQRALRGRIEALLAADMSHLLQIKGEPIGRMLFVLFIDEAPLAAENFRQLCTGEKVLRGYDPCVVRSTDT